MAIIESEISVEEKQVKTRLDIQQHLIQGARDQNTRAIAGWGYLWRNPYGLTPQQAADSLGTKALAIVQLQLAAKAIVDAIDPAIWSVPAAQGTVTPVCVDGHPTGAVIIVMSE